MPIVTGTVVLIANCALLLRCQLLPGASAPTQYHIRRLRSHAEVGGTFFGRPWQAPVLDYSLGRQVERSRPSSLPHPHTR
eukprot:COSAG02_NODE_18008_length_966_cov_1.213379_1_plen_80_part_00